jgi:Spx/MgsR family transcriptional regulator
MTTLYGIKNCDTVKKARTWLDAQNIPYRFHDFRADGLSAELLGRLEAALGWRALADSQREPLDRAKALELMLAQPALIKRPVLETGAKTLIGFTPNSYAREL